MMAADDCTHIVRMLPSNRKRSVLKMPQPPVVAKKLMTVWLWARSIATAFSRSVVRPRNMNAKPNTNSPRLLVEFFLV